MAEITPIEHAVEGHHQDSQRNWRSGTTKGIISAMPVDNDKAVYVLILSIFT